MALELQISAGNAKANLEAVTAAAKNLKAALDGMPQATRFTNLVKAFNGITGIPSGVISSIDSLARAVNQLGAAKDLSTLARGLNSIGRVDIAKVTANVKALSTALASIRIPPGLAQAGAALNSFAAAAQNASAQTRSLTASMRGFRVPSALLNSVNQVNSLSAAMTNARANTASFGSGMNSLNGVLAGFGVTLGAVGFGRFVSGLNDIEKQMASFRSIVDVSMKDVGGSAASLDVLRATADKLGLPLRELVDTYPKFATAIRLSGQSGAEANQIFKDLSVGLAGVGADAIKTQRVFKAVEQMFNKGTVTAEELKQQLGDAIPGAVQLFAKSMNIGTAELSKMMEAGQVASNRVGKFAALLAQEMGPAAEAMAKTWIGASNRMANAWAELQMSVSGSFFDAITPSVNSLASAVQNFVSSGAAASLGATLGSIAAMAIDLGAAITNLLSGPFGGIAAVFGGAVVAAGTLGATFKTLGMAASVLSLSSLAPLVTSLGSIGVAVASAIASFAMLNPVITAVAVAIGAAVVAYNMFAGATSTAAQSANQLYAAAQGINSEVDTMGEAMYAAANASNDWGISTTQLAQAQQVLGAEIGVIQGLVANYNEQLKAGSLTAEEHAQKMEELAARMDKVQEAMTNVARGAEKHRSAMNGASSATSSAASASDKASNSYRSMGSSMSSATSQAHSLDSALSALASTQRQLDTSTTSVKLTNNDGGTSAPESRGPVGFEGNMFDQGSLFSGGGISHKGTNKKWRNLPAALWKGAPKLAGGIENTNQILGSGGIPAVLHPNEAVVPLTGGGAIPVAGGGGGDISAVAGIMSAMYTVQLDTKTEVARVREAVNANTSVLKNSIDKVGFGIIALANSVAAIKSFGGGGGISGGGVSGSGGGTLGLGGTASGDIGTGGALTGGTGGSGTLFEFAQQAKSLSNALSQANDRVDSIYNSAPYFQYGTGNGPRIMLNPGDRQAYADAESAAGYAASAYEDYLWSNPTLAAAYYREMAQNAQTPVMKSNYEARAKQFESGKRYGGNNSFSIGFATGSPNAWKDTRGGFAATLHPDEAVIPLPDGRSVPVQMPTEVSALMDTLTREYRGTSRMGESIVSRSRTSVTSGTPRAETRAPITIQMNIQTPDAASFSKSKAQIMQEFKSEFDRIGSRLGAADKREDPTRRNKRA